MPSLSPAFRRLASSNLAAHFSEQIALAALAVLALGADAAQTGYLQTAQTLPFLLLSLPAGVLADRMQRRLLMSAAECARASACLLLALLWSGQLTLPLLAALGAVGTVAYNVAPPRWPRLVPRPIGGANRWLELARSAAFSAGPAAAARWSALGASAAYALATALSLLAALLLAGLPADAPAATAARRHIGRELTEGAAFVLRHPLLRPVLVTAVFFNVACSCCRPCTWSPSATGAGRRRRGPDAGDLWPGHGRRAAGAAPGALAELRRADRRRLCACWPAP